MGQNWADLPPSPSVHIHICLCHQCCSSRTEWGVSVCPGASVTALHTVISHSHVNVLSLRQGRHWQPRCRAQLHDRVLWGRAGSATDRLGPGGCPSTSCALRAEPTSPRAKLCLLPAAGRPALCKEHGVGRRAPSRKQNPSTSTSGIREDESDMHGPASGCVQSSRSSTS